MRNLTVILRDYEIRILELGDRVRSTKRHSRGGGSLLLLYRKPGAGAFNSAGNSSCMYDTWNPKTSPTVFSPIWDLNLANNDYKISSLQSVVWISSSVEIWYFLSYFNNCSFQSYPKIYFPSSRSLFVSKNHVYFGSCGDRVCLAFWRKSESSQKRGGFSSEEEKKIFWLFRRVENMVSETNSNNYVSVSLR